MAGGKLPRGGGSGYFRRLAEHVPPHIRTRVTEFIDSVAFKDEVRSEAEIAASSGEVAAHEHDSRYAPTDHGHVGFARSNHSHSWPTRIGQLLDVGILPPVDAGQVLIVNGAGSWQNQLPQFRSDLFAINGSEDETVSVVFDLSAISELEQRTIFAIDEDMTFPSAADWLELTDGHDTTLHTHQHELLYGIGYYDHAHIDNHLDDTDFFHDHGNLTGLDGDDHPAYLLASDATDRATFAANWIDLTDGGETTLHTHDGSYYTESEVDTLLTGYLPLTAGSTKPLIGDLYLSAAGSKSIILAGGGNSTYCAKLYHLNSSGVPFEISSRTQNWASWIDINPYAPTPRDEKIRFFTSKVSSTKSVFEIWDGTTGLDHSFTAGGNISLCLLGGILTVGSTASNGVLIDPVNGIYLYGSAMAWDDLRFPALDTKLGGSKDPSFAVFKTNGAGSQGVFLYWFDKNTEEELYFVAQLPHKWAQGTDLEVHCHWVPKATAAGAGTDVCWGLEYTWANIDGTFGDTAIIYGDEQTNGATETLTAGKHYLTELGMISGTGKTLSSMLVCRFFRDAGGTGGTDDYDDDAGLLEVDFHIQIDSFGSDDEYTKGP